MTQGANATATRPAPRALSHRDILAVSIPIILSNVTTPLVGAVDTAVIGQLGDAAMLGGVAIGAQLFGLIFWTFGFLRLGTSGMTAQAKGAGDQKEVAASLERAILVGLILGVIVIALQAPIGTLSLWLIGGSAEVQKAARIYYDWRIWSAPFVFINYALLGWFIGLAEAGRAFVLQILLNVINIVLSIVLVFGWHWGVAGAAAGSVMGEIVAAAAGLALAYAQITAEGGRAASAVIYARSALTRVFAVNADIMIRSVCLMVAFLSFTSLGARVGDVMLAANGILFDLFGIAAYFLDGFANAAETFVGQAIGAQRRDRLLDAVWLSSMWAVMLSLAVSVALILGGGAIIDVMTTNAEVRLAARQFLPWCALSPIAGVAAFQLDGIFIGATRGADMRNMMLLSVAVFLGAAWLLMPPFGNHGLWLALTIFFIVRGIALGSRFPALLRDAFGTSKGAPR